MASCCFWEPQCINASNGFQEMNPCLFGCLHTLDTKKMHALNFCPRLTKGSEKNQEKPTRKKQDFCQPSHVPQHHIPPKKNLIQSVTLLSPNVGLVTLKQPFQKCHRFHSPTTQKDPRFLTSTTPPLKTHARCHLIWHPCKIR